MSCTDTQAYSNSSAPSGPLGPLFFESDLFKAVQLSGMFSDSKAFADATPNAPIELILEEYRQALQSHKQLDLTEFVKTHFDTPDIIEIVVDAPSSDINEQIEVLWQALSKPAEQQKQNSLLALSQPYIVPGGRFREIYYWDSYFSALGLIESGKIEQVHALLDNFVDLQRRFKCIPNGNRSYYLSRSQPPILGLLVDLLLPHEPSKADQKAFVTKYLGAIESEYLFWMKGSEHLSRENKEYRRVVQMPCGARLNRYWDDSPTPRPESYKEDIELCESSAVSDDKAFYRNIRAACESGWDFSTRWLKDKKSLSTICTTRIIPIDLNCLLYKQEMLIADYYGVLNDEEKSAQYSKLAQQRRQAIFCYLWSEEFNYFMDFNLDDNGQTQVKSLAGVLPLFVGMASVSQAQAISDTLEGEFLAKGGLITTAIHGAQQWDAPNGWAPLHWFTVKGLLNYQQDGLANDVMRRWQNTVDSHFTKTGKLMEKYNVCHQSLVATGGEYDVQEGFGWTNGVYQAFRVYLA